MIRHDGYDMNILDSMDKEQDGRKLQVGVLFLFLSGVI